MDQNLICNDNFLWCVCNLQLSPLFLWFLPFMMSFLFLCQLLRHLNIINIVDNFDYILVFQTSSFILKIKSISLSRTVSKLRCDMLGKIRVISFGLYNNWTKSFSLYIKCYINDFMFFMDFLDLWRVGAIGNVCDFFSLLNYKVIFKYTVK